jgi:hypothetical protein
MADLSSFRRVFEAYGRSIGLERLDVDHNGYCLLDVDGVLLDVNYLEPRAETLLSAVVAPLPTGPSTRLLALLLERNYLLSQEGGAAFAIDAGGNALVLMRRFGAEGLSEEALAREIEAIIDLAIAAKAEVNALVQRGDAPSEQKFAPGDAGVLIKI